MSVKKCSSAKNGLGRLQKSLERGDDPASEEAHGMVLFYVETKFQQRFCLAYLNL
jgi:hypothetical protein